jgi:hypothetical protein
VRGGLPSIACGARGAPRSAIVGARRCMRIIDVREPYCINDLHLLVLSALVGPEQPPVAGLKRQLPTS